MAVKTLSPLPGFCLLNDATWRERRRFRHVAVTCPESLAIRAFSQCHGKFPAAQATGADMNEPDREESERERRLTNIGLMVALVVIAGIGIWLINALVDARKAEMCFESGRRNCNPITLPQPNRD